MAGLPKSHLSRVLRVASSTASRPAETIIRKGTSPARPTSKGRTGSFSRAAAAATGSRGRPRGERAAGRGRGPAGWRSPRGGRRARPALPSGRSPPPAPCRRRRRRRPPRRSGGARGRARSPVPGRRWGPARRRDRRRAGWRAGRRAPGRAAGAPSGGCRSGPRGACAGSEERPRGAGALRIAEVLVGPPGGDPAAGGALEEPLLDQVGLVEVLQGPRVLAHRDGQRLEAGGTPVVVLDQRGEDLTVDVVEAELIHLQEAQGAAGGRQVDDLRA